MKKWLWYAAVLAAAAVLSGNAPLGNDIGKLQPVQVVRVTSSEGQVVLQTDTGDSGVGDTLKDAFENMKQTASAEVFLDTADYLLVDQKCEALMPALMNYLRPSCAVCVEEGEPDMGRVGAFLEYQKPKVTLTRYKAGERKLPLLRTKDGRMELVS